MGCVASREKYNTANMAEARPEAIKAVLPGSALLSAPNSYAMALRLFRLREDYEIKDDKGVPAFRILGKLVSVRDRQYFADKSGKKLAMLQKKLLTFWPTYILYSYTPAYQGQPSVDTDGDAPVYRFGMVRTVLLSLPMRWEYLLYTNDNETPEKVGDVQSLCSCYAMGVMSDARGVPMFKFSQTAMVARDQGGNTSSTYTLEVALGMDPLQAIAVAIGCQQLADEASQS